MKYNTLKPDLLVSTRLLLYLAGLQNWVLIYLESLVRVLELNLDMACRPHQGSGRVSGQGISLQNGPSIDL